MEQKIVLEVECSDKDVRRAIFEIINWTNRLWVVSVCELVILGLVLFFGISNGFGDYYIGLISVLLFVYFLFVVIYYINPINKYVDAYKLRRESTYIFSNQNIEILRTDIQSLCSWNIFIKAVVLSQYVVLRDKNKALTILPKRCFKSESDIQVFLNLLSTKVKVLG